MGSTGGCVGVVSTGGKLPGGKLVFTESCEGVISTGGKLSGGKLVCGFPSSIGPASSALTIAAVKEVTNMTTNKTVMVFLNIIFRSPYYF
jgi:hypothetical protein